MGGALSRLLRAAVPFYDLVDRLYRRWHGLEEVGGLFYVGRGIWRGAGRRLEDGTELASGDAILHLHLNSQLVAADAAGSASAAAAGLRFARRFVPACRAVARKVREEPGWRDVVAVYAVGWVSPYVGEPWGFEFERLPGGLRTRFIRWHLGNLLAAATPPGQSRRRPRPWPMAMWMSRRRLCERFLDEAVSQ